MPPNYKIIFENAPELLINYQKCPRTLQKITEMPRFLFFPLIKNKTPLSMVFGIRKDGQSKNGLGVMVNFEQMVEEHVLVD